jgi:tyrosine-protein kinase Etk/Wzc
MRDPLPAALPQFPPPDASNLPTEPFLGGEPPPGGARFFWGIFRRNLWMILLSAAIITGLATFYTTRLPRTYQASSSIRVDDQRMNIAGIEQIGVGNQITTEMEMLRSRSLAEQVVHKLGLRLELLTPKRTARSDLFDSITVSDVADSGTYVLEASEAGIASASGGDAGATLVSVGPDGWVRLRGAMFYVRPAARRLPGVRVRILPREAAVDALRNNLNVNRLGNDANIILVQSRGPDPYLLRDVVNATAMGFIEQRQEAERAEARSRVIFLREQLDTLKPQLASSEDALRRYRQQAQIADLQIEASSQVSRLVQMQGDRSVLEVERVALENLLGEVQAAAAQAGPDSPSPYRRLIAFPTLFRNQAASELLRSLGSLEDQRSQLLTRRTAKDPDVQILTARIDQVDEQLRTIATTYLAGLTGQISALDTTLRKFGSDLQAIPLKELRVAQLERTPKVLNQMYELVQSRLKEAEIAQAAIDPSARIVDLAVAPLIPVSPRPLLNLTAGFLLGLFLGFGVAVLREWNDRSVHTRGDLARVTGVPVVGLIPRIPAMRRVEASLRRRKHLGKGRHRERTEGNGVSRQHGPLPHLLSGVTELGPVAQAFSRLDTYLSFYRPESPPRVVLFTSPLTGDGKTTTAVNFAVALALQGHRVLLVDTDLRRGIIDRIFGIRHHAGLGNLLAGTVSMDKVLRRFPVGEDAVLTCLTAGVSRARPEVLLSSPAMEALIERLRGEYEFIVLDSAPINVVTDAALLARHVDGVLIVARAAVTADEALAFAMEQLRSVRAPILGAVLNDVDLRRDISYDAEYKYHGYNDPYYTKVGR